MKNLLMIVAGCFGLFGVACFPGGACAQAPGCAPGAVPNGYAAPAPAPGPAVAGFAGSNFTSHSVGPNAGPYNPWGPGYTTFYTPRIYNPYQPGPYYFTPGYPYSQSYYSYYYTPGFFRY